MANCFIHNNKSNVATCPKCHKPMCRECATFTEKSAKFFTEHQHECPTCVQAYLGRMIKIGLFLKKTVKVLLTLTILSLVGYSLFFLMDLAQIELPAAIEYLPDCIGGIGLFSFIFLLLSLPFLPVFMFFNNPKKLKRSYELLTDAINEGDTLPDIKF